MLTPAVYRSSSPDETIALGRRLAAELQPGDTVLLIGDLGAGKTTLTKGLADGLGVAGPEEITSPTYTLIHEYGGNPRLYHIDLYRLDTPLQVATLGLDDLFGPRSIVLIEWGERFPDLMPVPRTEIRIAASGDERILTVTRIN